MKILSGGDRGKREGEPSIGKIQMMGQMIDRRRGDEGVQNKGQRILELRDTWRLVTQDNGKERETELQRKKWELKLDGDVPIGKGVAVHEDLMSKDLMLIECIELNAYMRTEEGARLGKENEVSGIDRGIVIKTPLQDYTNIMTMGGGEESVGTKKTTKG